MALIVDTQVLIWWLADDTRLGRGARALIEKPEAAVSIATYWEMAIKAGLGKLGVAEGLIGVGAGLDFDTLHIDEDDVWHVGRLPLLHRDPFDRMLIAQAQRRGLPIMTGDSAFAAYDVGVIDPRE